MGTTMWEQLLTVWDECLITLTCVYWDKLNNVVLCAIFPVKDQERRHDAEDRDGAEQRTPASVERTESAWSTWINLTTMERIVDSNLLILGPDDTSQMSQMFAQVELWKSCL